MSAYFPERANVFIDDNIVAPLLAKEYEEADNITQTFRYDPESHVGKGDAEEGSVFTPPTTLDTNSQEDQDGPAFKKYDDEQPRSCCQLLKSTFMIILAVGNAIAWVMSFFYSPFDLSDWNVIIVYIAGAICLMTTLLMIINERRILSYPTNLKEMVNEVKAAKRELKSQVDSLREEAEFLMQRATKCEDAEIQIRDIAETENLDGNDLISLVRENEHVLDLLRTKHRERVTEEVVSIVLRNGSPVISEATAKSLANEISIKLGKMGVIFDDEKFLQALASNPTLIGAIRTVKKLLPDQDYSEGKDDAYDMFYLSNEEEISRGSVHALRASVAGKQMSLAERNKRIKKQYGGDDEKAVSDEEEDPDRPKTTVKDALRQFWILAMPYFRENREGRCLFLVLIVITLGTSAVHVYFSYLIRDFYTALTKKHVAEFYRCFFKFLGSMVVLIPVQVSFRYMYTKLGIAWRKWLTERVLTLYFSNKVFYGLERQAKSAEGGARDYMERNKEVDNPDQRIQEDVSSFTGFSLSFFLTVIRTTLDLVSFSAILFSIMPELFIAIIVFAAVGTGATVLVGKVLIRLHYESLQREADFRFSLVRIRENAESIAFYGGEPVEERFTKQKFQRTIENSTLLNVANRNLDVVTELYNHLTNILPTLVLANQYFNGIIEYGVIAQVRGAFGHILSDLSIIIHQFNGIASFMAGIDRLFLFMKAIQNLDPDRPKDDKMVMMKDMSPPDDQDEDQDDTKSPQSKHAIQVKEVRATEPSASSPRSGSAQLSTSTILTMRDVRLVTPDNKRVLVQQLDLSLLRGKNLLIAGVSGSGKSSLLRAIAGLWSNGSGEIVRPSSDQIYFLPQRPYCPPGTLRDQLLYPKTELTDDYDGTLDGWSRPIDQRRVEWSSLSDQELLDVLASVDLADLASRIGDGDPIRGLNTVLDYSNTLSLGEQQRLAFGRVVINRPNLVVMDESTSALDVVAERKMYALLKNLASDVGLTYVSVGHRPTLLQYHDIKLLLRDGVGSVNYIPPIESSASEAFILS